MIHNIAQKIVVLHVEWIVAALLLLSSAFGVDSELWSSQSSAYASVQPSTVTVAVPPMPADSVKPQMMITDFEMLYPAAAALLESTLKEADSSVFTEDDGETDKSTNTGDEEGAEPEDSPFHQLILQAADRHDVDPALVKAVILAESNYNPRAISRRGAKGLMQLMPATAKALGVKDLFDPESNINGGVKYLRKLLDRFGGDVELALAAYNAGSRYVRKYRGVPPFRATRFYIRKVMKYRDLFSKEMADARNGLA
jgi:soluble lytic murein transglycosylase-like protein